MASRPDLAQRNRDRAIHGMSKTRTFAVWDSMRQRCNNPGCHAYKDYGGRGIRVCESWGSFANFLAAMGEAPKGMQLDRIDNNGNYEANNCRWVTSKVNCRNRRSCVFVEFKGQKKSVAEWAEVTGLERKTLEYRIRAGWSVEKALSTPSMTNRKNTNGNFIGLNQQDAA
jgi:hypothetical protein